jgi:hypothetical protein
MPFIDAAPDGYVRISLSALHSANLHHLESAIDASIAVPQGLVQSSPGDVITGLTEWAGSYGTLNLSVGWDWGLVRNLLVVLNPAEIRTNIRLINEQGYDESPLFTRIQILQRIELLPWREEDAIQKILGRGHKP